MSRSMLSDAAFLAVQDVRRMLRTRETVMWTFVMPVIFFYFIGTVTSSGIRQQGDRKDLIAVSVPPDAGVLADQLIASLETGNFRVKRIHPGDPSDDGRRLDIPAGFSQSALNGEAVTIHFTRVGKDPGAEFDRLRIQRAIDAAVSGRATAPRTLVLDVAPAGHHVFAPSGFQQSVPGTMVMFTLLVMFTSGAVTLTLERNQGILRRLASAPMSHGAVVLGKWGARMALGWIQITFAMITGAVLFNIHWGPNLPAIVLVLAAYGALAAMLGMLLGNLGRTEGQVIGMGVIATNIFAALGGCWWPIEITPLWTQKLSIAFPTGWTMDALHKLMNFGAPATTVLPHLAVLIAATLLAGYALARSFRFQ